MAMRIEISEEDISELEFQFGKLDSKMFTKQNVEGIFLRRDGSWEVIVRIGIDSVARYSYTPQNNARGGWKRTFIERL